MTRTRSTRLGLALAVAALALLAAACGDSKSGSGSRPTPTPAASFPVTLDRSDGKTLTLDAAPQRIVSLSPGATEIIYALGAEGSLAAVDNQADYPQAAKDFPTKVDAYQPNVEAIAGLDPDLVFVATDSDGIVAALDRLHVPVLFSDLNTVTTIDGVYDQIRLLGRATGTSGRAEDLVAALQARERAVTGAVADVSDGPRVYHELDSTFYTASDASFIGDLYRLLHARNIAGDGGGNPYPQLTQEAILAANPDVIVLADEEFGVSVDSVKARPGWDEVAAVKDNRIYGVDPDVISRPGPRIIDALETLAKDLYPEKFG
ncbi:MAG TPA: ABC transporter substrate-binding protein [Dehalococcoidia bacterium]|nr:ABC transporter substrate-binding protein [Dehalococcoidia bacterium]